jgi:hypothetical protein
VKVEVRLSKQRFELAAWRPGLLTTGGNPSIRGRVCMVIRGCLLFVVPQSIGDVRRPPRFAQV